MKVTNVQPPQAKRSRQIPRGLCVRLCVSCFHKANISSSLQACVQRVHATMDDDMQYDHGTEGYIPFPFLTKSHVILRMSKQEGVRYRRRD